jgi:predicted RNA binding protein YcfA (HicA-like mRNA interferase family)
LWPLSSREVIRILEDHGFVRVRQRGSHIALQRAVSDDQTITVGDEILIGTRMLREYRLQIDFPAQTLTLEKA